MLTATSAQEPVTPSSSHPSGIVSATYAFRRVGAQYLLLLLVNFNDTVVLVAALQPPMDTGRVLTVKLGGARMHMLTSGLAVADGDGVLVFERNGDTGIGEGEGDNPHAISISALALARRMSEPRDDVTK